MRTFDDRRWWGVWLFAVLAAAVVAQVVGFRPNDIESGAAVGTPTFAPSRLFDEEYFAEIDAWIDAEFALRGAGLRARAAVDYELLGDSTNPESVTVGDDDWLFFTEYLHPDCGVLDDVQLPEGVRGSDAYFVVTSPKAAYHPDRLADPEAPCVATARADRDARLAASSVDLDTELRDLADEGLDVFLRDDTHWSMEARLRVAGTIVDSVAPGLWDDDAIVTGEVERLADLARLIGILRDAPALGPVTTLEVEVLDSRRVSLNGELLVLQVSRSDLEGAIPGVTYLVGDSQMSYVVPLIAPYFEELRFANWFLVEGFGFAATDWPEPDRLVVQTIELEAAERFASADLASFLERLDG